MNRNLMLLGLFSIGALSAIQAEEPTNPATEVTCGKNKPAPADAPVQTTDSSETTQAEEPKTEDTNEESR